MKAVDLEMRTKADPEDEQGVIELVSDEDKDLYYSMLEIEAVKLRTEKVRKALGALGGQQDREFRRVGRAQTDQEHPQASGRRVAVHRAGGASRGRRGEL